MLKMLALHSVPFPAQEGALLATMHAFNNAAIAIAEFNFSEHPPGDRYQ